MVWIFRLMSGFAGPGWLPFCPVAAWDVDKPSDDLVDGDASSVFATPALPAVTARPDLVLQPRDLEIFSFVARHGVCTPGQLSRRFWPAAHINGTYRRVEKLV